MLLALLVFALLPPLLNPVGFVVLTWVGLTLVQLQLWFI
jgi:hypothetical protein